MKQQEVHRTLHTFARAHARARTDVVDEITAVLEWRR
jgi:hypothetical protein